MQLPYAEDYLSRNSGAHRRPALQVGTTCITQRLGFWAPQTIYRERENNASLSAWEEWVGEIEQCVLNIFRNLRDLSQGQLSSPNLTDRRYLELFNGVYDVSDPQRISTGKVKPGFEVKRLKTASFSFVWASVPVEMRVELHTEHFELTTYMDFSSTEGDKYLNDRTGDLKDVFDALGFIGQIARERNAALLKGAVLDNDSDRAKFRDAKITLYKKVWERLWDQVTGPSLINRNVGHAFADFRGLSATFDPIHLIADAGHDDHKAALKSQIGTLAFDDEVMARKLSKSQQYTCDVINLVDTFWPLVTADMATEGQNLGDFDKDIFRREEYAFCTFCDNRYIYGTALGVQHSKEQSPEPLHYFIFAANPDRWQHGRLLDRLQLLGICRLAALAHFSELTKTNGQLRHLENKLDDLSEKADIPSSELLRSAISISQEIGKIGTSVPSGLSYRTERSKYYVQQFEKFSDPLRQKRIEGFQPYIEFVQRRLTSTFDFIEMTGVRFRRLSTKARELQRRLQAGEALDVQSNIRHIQSVAEAFFLLMVAPYYVGSVVEHIVPHDWLSKAAAYLLAIALCWGILAWRSPDKLRVGWAWLLSRPKWLASVLAARWVNDIKPK